MEMCANSGDWEQQVLRVMVLSKLSCQSLRRTSHSVFVERNLRCLSRVSAAIFVGEFSVLSEHSLGLTISEFAKCLHFNNSRDV